LVTLPAGVKKLNFIIFLNLENLYKSQRDGANRVPKNLRHLKGGSAMPQIEQNGVEADRSSPEVEVPNGSHNHAP
jgi:hypothetical protein